MADKVKKLNLSIKTVKKLIKEVLPESVVIEKDVEDALNKAGMMFVLHITTLGSEIARKNNRQNLIAQDIIDALREAEFEEFNKPLEELLAELSKTKNGNRSYSEEHEEEEKIEEEEDE